MAKIVFKELTSNQNVLFPVNLSEKDSFQSSRTYSKQCCRGFGY